MQILSQQHGQVRQSHSWIDELKNLFKIQCIQTFLTTQIEQILPFCQSVIVLYQKLFIKFKIFQNQEQSSLYMLRISKSFPLANSVRLYLLNGQYQPQIFDSRDLISEVLGQAWSYEISLATLLSKIPAFETKLIQRNENYLALQKTGEFILGDVFVFNQLQEHTSLNIFTDRLESQNGVSFVNILNCLTQTHFLVFRRAIKKLYKSKEEQDYQMKSKTLYGKKFILENSWDLQCVESIQINLILKQLTLSLVKYSTSLKSLSDCQTISKKINFVEEESMKNFIRIILKNLPKYQETKINFMPAYDKSSQEELCRQKIIELNQIEQRLQACSLKNSKSALELDSHDEIINKLNKSYQKIIQYYSARAHPYYLIYVSKLNSLYQKYFIQRKSIEQSQEVKSNP